jgi:hypothetical protein
MKYKPLFEVSIVHPYYEDERCPDIRVVASAESEALLRRHHAVLKDRSDGALVVVAVKDDGAPFRPFPAGASLTFDLRVVHADFHLMTDTAAIKAMAGPVYTNAAGQSPLASGALSLVDRGANAAERRDRSVLARLEIAGLSGFMPSMPPASFRVAFDARKARWVYYVVTDVPAETTTGALRIVDADPAPSGGALVFGELNARDLVATPDANDPVARALAARFPGKRRIRFVSDAPVAASARGRKYIEFRTNGISVEETLPNPSIAAYTRVEVGEPAAPVDAWYGVIEVMTQGAMLPAL